MPRLSLWAVSALLCCVLIFNKAFAQQSNYQIETIVDGLNSPWALAFLPGGDMLITELGGTLRRISDGELVQVPITGVPPVYYAGQGGLMDVVTDAEFNRNQRVYLSFAHGDKSGNATRMISARLVDMQLEDVEILFTAKPLKKTPHHYSARIAQMADGSLLMGVGDGFNYREQAQTLDNHLGKVIRIQRDGQVPSDNPWADDPQALPEIWSRGHRNMQAILVAPDGTVFANEHGPQGGDEVNIITPGLNYGWPVITYGIDYSGARISPYTEYAGMEQPLVDWTPSIAPAGMTYYDGSQFPQWQGSLFTVSLAERSIRRTVVEQGKLVSDEKVFPELNDRMRDIRTGPDGALYVLTDGENGKLIRISSQ
ncbi:MAG: PQQ-dependent sugar dehydrogenase [Pseudomonadota bacterium]